MGDQIRKEANAEATHRAARPVAEGLLSSASKAIGASIARRIRALSTSATAPANIGLSTTGAQTTYQQDYLDGVAYQIIGALADRAGLYPDPAAVWAMDYLSVGGIDPLPFEPIEFD